MPLCLDITCFIIFKFSGIISLPKVSLYLQLLENGIFLSHKIRDIHLIFISYPFLSLFQTKMSGTFIKIQSLLIDLTVQPKAVSPREFFRKQYFCFRSREFKRFVSLTFVYIGGQSAIFASETLFICFVVYFFQ